MTVKNNRAPDPDGVKSEDIKTMHHLDVSLTLNNFVMTESSILKEGFIEHIVNPGKNACKAASYRPIMLMLA